jgi:hypothetical protein
MRRSTRLRPLLAGAALLLALAGPGFAQSPRIETVAPAAAAAGTVLEGDLRGDGSAEYLVAAEAGQILSVDLSSPNASLQFNILPQGASEALFVGATSGNVADVPVPATGTYVVQVYLMRNAARRGEVARYALGIGLAGADLADSLAGGPDWWAVAGLTGGEALNVRSGPATRYDVVGKATNGEVMQNRGCRMTGPERWCSVRVDGSGVQGWVAGQYLVETAAPAMPEMPAGGPVGNGVPFDATGSVPCAPAEGQPMQSCLFGVVRDGPGNAGVWIATGTGEERQILFEGGVPVASTGGGALSYARSGDLTQVTLGAERYEIPDAVVNGG